MRYFTLFILLIFGEFVVAQSTNFNSSNDWMRTQKELVFGFGTSNVLSDLGGLDRIGTDYSFVDLETSQFSLSAQAGYRYRFHKNWAYRGSLSWVRVKGSDQLTQEPYRNYRNLHFRTDIYELYNGVEWGFSRDRVGHRYGLKGLKGFKNSSSYWYVGTGLGVFWFNPKAQHNGGWTALQPLGTEGQLAADSLKKYSRISVSIPLNAGFRFLLGKKITIGLEVSFRKIFTDYLDDVSGDYYDNNLIRQAGGDVAAELADPSSGNFYEWTIQGEQRGDPTTKDAFMSGMLTFGYNLSGFGYRSRTPFQKNRRKRFRASF